MPPAASKPTHNNTQTVPSLSRRDKSEDWTFEESKTRIWIELWRETKSNILFPRRRKDPIDCSMLATCPHCRCPVSGLCHCWGRGQNFPHYRQNYFPNTLISTCPALILLLKSDKSSQMLHYTVQNRSLSWKHPENCWAVSSSAHETNNKQSTVHPFRDRSNDDHALKVATIQFMDLEIHFVSPSCWLPKPKQFEPELEIWWTSRNCNHSVPNGRSVAPIKKSFRTIPYLSHMWLASRRLLHIIFIDNDNRQYLNIDFKIGNGKQRSSSILTSIYS